MDGDTELLIELTRRAAKFLHRDYFELENLQQSGNTNLEFCQRSISKVNEALSTGLSKYYKNVINLNSEVTTDKLQGKAAVFDPIDSISNMARSLPFFAVVLSVINFQGNKIIPEKIVINFPILGEVYYAEKGQGAWLERYSSNIAGNKRLRVSKCNNLDDSLIMMSNKKMLDEPVTKLEKAGGTNVRIFGSYAYIIAMLASGKADCGIFELKKPMQDGISLLVQEAGGRSSVKDDFIVATNFHLYEKISHN